MNAQAKPVLHNIRPQLALNQHLTPEQAQPCTSLAQIEGKLCRFQLTIDFHYEPGDERARALLAAYQALEPELDADGNSSAASLDLIPVETILGNVAAHAAEIMSCKAPSATRFHPIPGMPPVAFRCEPTANPDLAYGAKGQNTWDQTWINDIHCGNRCGGRTAFIMLCAPAFALYYRCAAETFKLEAEGNYYRGERQKLYASAGRKVKP